MINIILLILFAICSYFIGNINWAIIISKLKNSDIRKLGSGNPGTLNMSRNFGLKIGLLIFFLDVFKGAIPTIVSYFVFRNSYFGEMFPISDFSIYLCGLFVVLGHIYPVVFKFKGGKGIASTIGVFSVTICVHGWPWVLILIMSLIMAVLFIYITEFGAMGSFIAITPPAVSESIRMFLTYSKIEDKITTIFNILVNLLLLLICFFTWFAHRKNIERMLSGDEHPTSIKTMVIKAKMEKKGKNN